MWKSRSLTELTRQITPPTKNGHAPPPTESRKSSQSVDASSVWAWWEFPAQKQAKVMAHRQAGLMSRQFMQYHSWKAV